MAPSLNACFSMFQLCRRCAAAHEVSAPVSQPAELPLNQLPDDSKQRGTGTAALAAAGLGPRTPCCTARCPAAPRADPQQRFPSSLSHSPAPQAVPRPLERLPSPSSHSLPPVLPQAAGQGASLLDTGHSRVQPVGTSESEQGV